jgi:hypothetical protein
MALRLSGRLPRIYFAEGSSTDSFERARSPGYGAFHKTGHGNPRDLDHRNALDHEAENRLSICPLDSDNHFPRLRVSGSFGQHPTGYSARLVSYYSNT